jgi:putative peptidoglycan lipid II flippase
VAAGILLSRILGLVRNRVFAHFFGTSDAADAFNAAFRIPNFLQNLFGEGVLSASFIPVYARLLGREEEEEARRLAGAVFTLLALASAVLVLLGVLATPALIALIAPGFSGQKREITIRLVRILFPGAGLLVLSAWCLGVLNSHRRFFLSYTAPVLWNIAIIVTLIAFGRSVHGYHLAEYTAWGSVLGSALQFGVQLPPVLGVLGGLTLTLQRQSGSDCDQEFRSGVYRTRGGTDQCLRRHRAGEPASHWSGGGTLLCAGALHPSGEPLRDVGLGGRVAGHGARNWRRQ